MNKHKKTEGDEVEQETGEMNDIACVDCARAYPLVDGASNCRCKRCNTLYKVNHNIEFRGSLRIFSESGTQPSTTSGKGSRSKPQKKPVHAGRRTG